MNITWLIMNVSDEALNDFLMAVLFLKSLIYKLIMVARSVFVMVFIDLGS